MAENLAFHLLSKVLSSGTTYCKHAIVPQELMKPLLTKHYAVAAIGCTLATPLFLTELVGRTLLSPLAAFASSIIKSPSALKVYKNHFASAALLMTHSVALLAFGIASIALCLVISSLVIGLLIPLVVLWSIFYSGPNCLYKKCFTQTPLPSTPPLSFNPGYDASQIV